VSEKAKSAEAEQEKSAGDDVYHFAGDDAIVPFAVDALNTRGRIGQMGAALNDLISRHNYPEPIASLLAQAAVLTALIGSSLKFKGKYSLQTLTDGAVTMLVCDYRTPAEGGQPGTLRAYARYDEKRLDALSPKQKGDQGILMGKGTMAFTIDEGLKAQLYQGVVPLSGEAKLERAAMEYFSRSEQIPTKIRLSSALLSTRKADGSLCREWRGGGIVAQYLPMSSETEKKRAELTAQTGFQLQSDEDKWREAVVLTSTVEDIELTDPQLPAERLLYRLFHEQGVRVYSPERVMEKCTCSREKLHTLIAGFSEQERRDSVENGKISAKCQFCSKEYEFSPDEFSSNSEVAAAVRVADENKGK